MRICFVSRGKISETEDRTELETADLVVFGFDGIGEVSYEKELKGESGYFERLAQSSARRKNLVVCGCVTDTRGHKRKSAVVAENGRILGVSDMLNVIDGEVGSGASLRVYDTKIGKAGVVVADDLNFPETVKALAVCGSDFIVCPFGGVIDSLQAVLLRAYAYCYGVPIFFCGIGYSMVADVSGNIAFASPQPIAEYPFENVKEYHLIETRRRGFYRPSL